MRQAFGLDLNKCTGCHSCLIACRNENQLATDISWRQVVVFNRQKIPHLPVLSYSMGCNHCENPPCVQNCPARAYEIDDRTGAVSINGEKCMGCKYCQWVCPYDAPSYDREVGVMTKCTFCSHLDGDEPACVNACPTGALSVCEYQDEPADTEMVPDIWRAGIKPALMVAPVRKEKMVPDFSLQHDQGWLNEFLGKMKRKVQSAVSLKTEWSLLVFTLGAPLMFAVFTAGILKRIIFPAWLYILSGLFCMSVSTVHLGKKLRFFRSIFNWKGSWLSREILFFSSFFGASALVLLLSMEKWFVSGGIVILGIVALFSFDRVYLVDSNYLGDRFHNASVLFMGIYLAALLAYIIPLFVGAGLIKFFLYLNGRQKKARRTGDIRFFLFRIFFGILVPGVLLMVSAGGCRVWITLSVLLGEVIARTEFYLDLEFMRPQTKAYMDLEKMLHSDLLVKKE